MPKAALYFPVQLLMFFPGALISSLASVIVSGMPFIFFTEWMNGLVLSVGAIWCRPTYLTSGILCRASSEHFTSDQYIITPAKSVPVHYWKALFPKSTEIEELFRTWWLRRRGRQHRCSTASHATFEGKLHPNCSLS